MADEDEVANHGDDEIIDGAEGEGLEGQDPAGGDEGSEVPADGSDASSAGDDGLQDRRQEGDAGQHVTRGGNRFQRLSNDNAALRDELAAMRRQRETEAARQTAQQQQWDQDQWNQRWSVMTPDEKVDYAVNWGQQQANELRNQMGAQVGLLKDQLAYDAKATINPVYAKYKDEVEDQYQQYWQQGRHIPRETLLYQMIGRKAVETAGSSTRRARAQGQKKIEAQTTRPSTSKGDAASTRGKAGDSAEKRLAGVEI
jgi:hypothetical protein